MNLRELAKRWLRMCGDALNGNVSERVGHLDGEMEALRREVQTAKLMETQAALLRASIHVVENLQLLIGRTAVECDARFESGEAALLEFLYSHVPSRMAIAGEANSRELAAAGFEVYSFASSQAPQAVGARAGNGRGVRAITQGELPHRPGILSFDGDALQKLSAVGDRDAHVITAAIPARLEALVEEMRAREYHWFLVLYRSPAHEQTHFYANHAAAIAEASGTVFFFREFAAFAEAQAWCAAAFSRTYFKPTQA